MLDAVTAILFAVVMTRHAEVWKYDVGKGGSRVES
jgi:hypothetical protein